MNTPDCTHHRDAIIRHFRDGEPWGAEARDHYAGCLDCITEVTSLLSQQADGVTVPVCGSASQTPLPEPARRALAHGEQVLKRMFGIQTGTKGAPT
jgi:hypothetical protein